MSLRTIQYSASYDAISVWKSTENGSAARSKGAFITATLLVGLGERLVGDVRALKQ